MSKRNFNSPDLRELKDHAHPVRDHALLVTISELVELRARMNGIFQLHTKEGTTDAEVREIVARWLKEDEVDEDE